MIVFGGSRQNDAPVSDILGFDIELHSWTIYPNTKPQETLIKAESAAVFMNLTQSHTSNLPFTIGSSAKAVKESDTVSQIAIQKEQSKIQEGIYMFGGRNH